MKNIENKSIKEYIDAGLLEKGQYLYSYIFWAHCLNIALCI